MISSFLTIFCPFATLRLLFLTTPMGLPGHRRTSSHKRRRAAHFALPKTVAATCEKCKEPVLPHRACKNCGFYRGRTVVSQERAVRRTVKKAATKRPAKATAADHDHDHDHDHEGHDHAHEDKKA